MPHPDGGSHPRLHADAHLTRSRIKQGSFHWCSRPRVSRPRAPPITPAASSAWHLLRHPAEDCVTTLRARSFVTWSSPTVRFRRIHLGIVSAWWPDGAAGAWGGRRVSATIGRFARPPTRMVRPGNDSCPLGMSITTHPGRLSNEISARRAWLAIASATSGDSPRTGGRSPT